MKEEVVIGIDIGGTNTKFGIINRSGHSLAEKSITTTGYSNVDDYLKNLSRHLNDLLSEQNGNISLKGIGVGAPNGNIYRGTIENAPNLSWGRQVPFIEKFKQHFDVPMLLTNDANAAAIGEMYFGGAKGMRDFIVITLGTGVGSGLVSNGELIYGHDGFAGELGHITVDYNGRDCGCGRKGCLETYTSATGIVRTVYELLAKRTHVSELRKIPFTELTSARITEEAHKGDPIAIEAFEYTGMLLGRKLADTVAHTSPEAIFLFGGLAKAGKLIFDPTQRHMEGNLLPIYCDKIKLLPSGLEDKNIAVMGAGALIWKELDHIGSK